MPKPNGSVKESTQVNIKELRASFIENGPTSARFCKQVEGFIHFVMLRHHGKIDNDLKQACYLRIFQSLEYYDPSRNLTTFLYSAIRNEISKHNYRIVKSKYREAFLPDSVKDDRGPKHDIDYRFDIKTELSNLFSKLKLSVPLLQMIESEYHNRVDNPFTRSLSWTLMKSRSL